MMITFAARAVSLLVLIGYVVAAHRLGMLGLMLKIGLPMLLAIACIWFPDAFGAFSGVIHYRAITTPTPGIIVAIVGWLILVGLPLLVWCAVNGTQTP
jgi:uncharacterized membrane protein YhdT